MERKGLKVGNQVSTDQVVKKPPQRGVVAANCSECTTGGGVIIHLEHYAEPDSIAGAKLISGSELVAIAVVNPL
jgi:hypothetical protein